MHGVTATSSAATRTVTVLPATMSLRERLPSSEYSHVPPRGASPPCLSGALVRFLLRHQAMAVRENVVEVVALALFLSRKRLPHGPARFGCRSGGRPASRSRSAARGGPFPRPPGISSGGRPPLSGARRPPAGHRPDRGHRGDWLERSPVPAATRGAGRSAARRLAEGQSGHARPAVGGDRRLARRVAVRRGGSRAPGRRHQRPRRRGRQRMRARGRRGRASWRARRRGVHDCRPRLGRRRRVSRRELGADGVDCDGRRGGQRAAAGNAAATLPLSAAEPAHQRARAGSRRRRGGRPERIPHHRTLRRRAGPGGDGGAGQRPQRAERGQPRADPRRRGHRGDRRRYPGSYRSRRRSAPRRRRP